MKRAANAALLLALGAIGCSGCGDDRTSGAGPSDGGGVDAVSDASVDAIADAHSDVADSAVVDTGSGGGGLGDAGVVDEGEWVRSPFSDFLGCTVEQPNDLSKVTKATWGACPGDVAGCRTVDLEYLANTGADARISFLASVDVGASWLLGVNRKPATNVYSPTVYAESGLASAAWRFYSDQGCALFVFRVGLGRIGMVLTPTEAARQSNGVTQRIAIGTPAELLAGAGEHYDLMYAVTNLNGVETLSFSDSIVVADGQPGGRLYVAQRPNGTFEEVPKQGGRLWDKHTLVGNDVIVPADDDLADLYIRHPDGTVALLKGDPSVAEGRPGADTSFIAWQEASGGTLWSGFQHMEVWSGPYTSDPASLQPHKAADVPNTAFYDFAFGEGWYIVQLEAGGARFVHLSDSKYVDIAAPTGLQFTQPITVAGGEAWFLMKLSPGPKEPVTIARYDLASVAAKLP